MTTCPTCGTSMRPLFNSVFCPRDCDRAAVCPTGEVGVVNDVRADGSIWTLGSGERVVWRSKNLPPAPPDRAWHLPPDSTNRPPKSISEMWAIFGNVANGGTWRGGLVAPGGRGLP